MNELETWLGKNALAAIALALVVAGLLLLGLYALPDFAFAVKVAATSAFAGIAAALPRGIGGGSERSARAQAAYRTAILVVYELALLTIAVASYGEPYRYETAFLCMAAVLLAVRFVPGRAGAARCYTALRVNETCVLALGALCMSTGDGGSDPVSVALFAGFAVVGLALVALRVKEAREGTLPNSRNAAFAVLTALVACGLEMAFFTGCTTFADAPYAASVLCMVGAIAALACGFALNMKALRVFGLVLTLGCVLKLVFGDAAALDVLPRVACFLAAGALCFCASLLYTRLAKNLPPAPPAAPAPSPFGPIATGNVAAAGDAAAAGPAAAAPYQQAFAPSAPCPAAAAPAPAPAPVAPGSPMPPAAFAGQR